MTTYPREFTFYAKGAKVKKTFVSDIQSINPKDCDNCGGMGKMTIFCAMEGPFESPCYPGKETSEGQSMSSHFDESVKGWWNGVMFSHDCPDCKGLGREQKQNYNYYPTQKAIEGIGHG